MATGPTTPYKPGDKVTIQLAETITHGGHYRVALATSGNMMDLPQDMSMADSGSMCEHDDMQAMPVFPILADGMLEHTQSQKLNGVQSFDVTLPSNVTCDKCVLQVREYMTPHTSTPETSTQTNGCYYHHCAFISISSGSGSGGMSSSGGAPNGGAPGAGAGGSSGGVGMGGVSMGGAMGQAGAMPSSGGAPGTAGGPTAGHAGTGAAGMPGAGGVVSGTGGSAASGTGGTSTNAGTGGSGTGGTGTAGAPGSSTGGTKSGPVAPPAADQSGGCGVSKHGRSAPFGFAGALGLGIWLARRRRR